MQANLSKPAQISLISVTKDHCEMEKQRIKKKKKTSWEEGKTDE